MEENQASVKDNNKADVQKFDYNSFDYDNLGWPRDFDIRVEVAEQREIID